MDPTSALLSSRSPSFLTMLGRLLSSAASTLNPASYSTKNATQLESVTEEEHTSGLLFPDANLLRHSNTHAYPLHTAFNSPNASNAGAFDDRGGLGLDSTRDFRVIIAQNALGDRDPCILLDTGSPSADQTPQGLGLDPQTFQAAGARHSRAVSSISRGSRRGYLSRSQAAEPSPLSLATDARRSSPINSSAFSRARVRSSTLSPSGGWQEPGPSRLADSNDSGLLNCIFGSSAFSYRGSSTKMHIISADEEPGKAASMSPAARNSLPRANTTGSPSSFIGPNRAGDSKPPSKVTVLLTRMFSVNLPEGVESPTERQDYMASMYQESLPETGFPFPDLSKRKKVKEKKTPMYAVAITIQIPLLSRNAARPFSRFSTQGPGSPSMAMACSLDSDYRWRGGFLDDSLSLASPPASLDERIDLLVDHWDVITRTLTHLENLARKEVLFLLKKVDSLSGVHPKPAKPPNMQRTNQTIVHLPANILSYNSKLRDEALRSSRRISTALQMPYVVTGQSRWGVWREEGRSIVRTLGEKEHGFFFLVLITAFLGNHTEWLNALGPDWYRRRHYLQQKAQQDSDPVIINRTVIVSPDKMTARRLIFLLSAFLPAKQRFDALPSPARPDTATSMRGFSQSPPGVPLLRQESLRRAIERRSRAQRLNLPEADHHHRSVSTSSNETAHRSSDDPDPTLPMDYVVNRRGSDARSIKTLNIPMHVKESHSKNTSTATTSTATPGSTVPVPHFAARQAGSNRESFDQATAGGNDSLASENLLRNLQRSESSAISSNNSVPSASGRWGNLFSGLWNSRPESSAAGHDTPSLNEARKRSGTAVSGSSRRGRTTSLSQMVREVSSPTEGVPQCPASGNISIPHTSNHQHGYEETQDLSSMTDQVKESPLKMSVRAEDGIVDVDLPLPGFISLSSSGDSTVASPKKTRTSVTSVDALGSTHSSGSGFHCAPRDAEGPNINVAGWLKQFHDDFLLQAVRPYNGLEADIKRAMQTETPPNISFPFDVDGIDRWVDVATTLIADAKTFTVKRLRLRRKFVATNTWPSPFATAGSGTPPHAPGFSANSSPAATSPADNPGLNFVEEQFVEEPVMDLDGTLVDAVERVLAQSGQSSLAHSRAPSPPRIRKRERSMSELAPRDEVPSLEEVPRGQCRKMVLGALEEVVRSVTAEHCREDVDDDELAVADRERKRSLAGADNTLREGVRKWLLDVEEAW